MLDFLKTNNFNFTHLESSKNIYKIYQMMFDNDLILGSKIFLGKPFAFYAYIIMLKNNKVLSEDQTIQLLNELIALGFDSVITQDQLNYLLKNSLSLSSDQKEYFKPFIYLDSTIGSALSVAIGYVLSVKDNDPLEDNYPKRINVILPDSLLHMGEFYEGLCLIKKFNLQNKLNLIIDYNGRTKQNDVLLSSDQLQTLFEIFGLK